MKPLLPAAALTLAGVANAGSIISTGTVDTHFGNGRQAALQTLEWLHLGETAGVSRDDVLDNKGVSFVEQGWRYATRGEAETLITSLWGGVYNGWSADNHVGADWFVDTFGFTQDLSDNPSLPGWQWSRFFFGNAGECDPDPQFACVGLIQRAHDADQDFVSENVVSGIPELAYENDPDAIVGVGYLREDWGTDMGTDPANTRFPTRLSLDDTAHLLVREIALPPTALLFLCGLLGLRYSRLRSTDPHQVEKTVSESPELKTRSV